MIFMGLVIKKFCCSYVVSDDGYSSGKRKETFFLACKVIFFVTVGSTIGCSDYYFWCLKFYFFSFDANLICGDLNNS